MLLVDVNIDPKIIVQFGVSDSFVWIESIAIEIQRDHPFLSDPSRVPERADYFRNFGILYTPSTLASPFEEKSRTYLSDFKFKIFISLTF